MFDKARALFEAGKSSREIEKKTGIPASTILHRSKKEGWVKNNLVQVIAERARVLDDVVQLEQTIEQLSNAQKDIVIIESNRIAKVKRQRDSIVDIAMNRIKAELATCEGKDIKVLVEAADRACIMSEAAPRFNPVASTQISNTNQVLMPVKIEIVGV